MFCLGFLLPHSHERLCVQVEWTQRKKKRIKFLYTSLHCVHISVISKGLQLAYVPARTFPSVTYYILKTYTGGKKDVFVYVAIQRKKRKNVILLIYFGRRRDVYQLCSNIYEYLLQIMSVTLFSRAVHTIVVFTYPVWDMWLASHPAESHDRYDSGTCVRRYCRVGVKASIATYGHSQQGRVGKRQQMSHCWLLRLCWSCERSQGSQDPFTRECTRAFRCTEF